MATQVSLNDGAVASAGALAIQTNGTTQAVSISTGQVATLAQNPVLTSGTANGVAYLNGSKVLTTGSALVFDGSNLGLGVTPSAWTSVFKAAQVKQGSISTDSSNNTTFANNCYFDGSNWKYINTAASQQYLQYAGQHIWTTAASGTAGNPITFTQAMTLDASGNLALGNTTSLSSSSGRIDLTVNGTSSSMVSFGTGGTRRGYALHDATDFTIASETAGSIRFLNNGSERARIDSSGNTGIGTTSTTAVRLIVKGSTSNGTSNAFKLIDSADADILAMSTAGDFYLPKMGSSTGTTVVLTSGNYLVKSSSSIRYKKDVEPIDIGLNFVLGLNPVKYKMKLDDANQVGFIAEDFPDERLVSFSLVNPQDKQSELQRESVNYANLVAPLVKAIQEQQAIIQSLTARITALEGASA